MHNLTVIRVNQWCNIYCKYHEHYIVQYCGPAVWDNALAVYSNALAVHGDASGAGAVSWQPPSPSMHHCAPQHTTVYSSASCPFILGSSITVHYSIPPSIPVHSQAMLLFWEQHSDHCMVMVFSYTLNTYVHDPSSLMSSLRYPQSVLHVVKSVGPLCYTLYLVPESRCWQHSHLQNDARWYTIMHIFCASRCITVHNRWSHSSVFPPSHASFYQRKYPGTTSFWMPPDL